MVSLPFKVAVTGATGFVGTQLVGQFLEKGYQVISLSRQDMGLEPSLLAQRIEGCQGIINLAGAPVLQRWSVAYKKVMFQSRVDLTRNLVAAFGLMETPPQVFISTSATGIYAEQGTHTEDEHCYGDGFLASLAKAWEAEAVRATEYGVRTALFRFGVVLGSTGGPVAEMLLPFKLGLGGKIGTGLQSFSWIHLDDLIQAYFFVLADATCSGTYNLVAPHPSTNLGMTKALGKALARPTVLTIPSFILKLRFGEGALILTGGQAVLPQRLFEAGFTFQFTDINAAMVACVA